MKKVTRHPRIVEATIDSDVTIKGQRFVEYFNDLGKFYPEDLEKPTGIGVFFQNRKMSNKDWFDQGLVRIVDTVHFKDTKWWTVIKDTFIAKQYKLREESNKIAHQIHEIDMILFDPITHYSKEIVDEN